MIEGNTVRRIQPQEEPRRSERPRRREHRRTRENSVQYVNVIYTVFLVVAACLLMWSCVNYLQLQAEMTSRVKNISSLESELEELRTENDDYYTRIMSTVDLEYIREVATEELGMVYADSSQVILYDSGTDDYVRQNGEIPTE
ncbi:MAG: cell division protein FtsL [Lachnospiraceae bacterium]|nr:cell division protein FtsL [Lachnospiraceae bacterium]MCD8248981.1 cell division protein FtsL [Lachnospiraceae bacterium]